MTPYVVNIDVDTLNTEFIRSLPITPNDQTCNPAWLSLALQDPSKAELIRTTALELQDQGFLAILSRLVVPWSRQALQLHTTSKRLWTMLACTPLSLIRPVS
ncbi:hypothetical protein LB505_012687 [Fusarium chuoi]|nr:hypothetical protein LB505_012687 [Fusarium chuoi]